MTQKLLTQVTMYDQLLTKIANDMHAKQKHLGLGVKKCEFKKNQRLKAMISTKAKKFVNG